MFNCIHLTGIWKTFGSHIRFIAKSAVVHPSTKERIDGYPGYHPTNLPHSVKGCLSENGITGNL